MIHPNREAWLLAATENLRSCLFKQHGAEVPNVRVSVGFPGGRSPKKAIGQYWPSQACIDATASVFVSPVLHEPLRALDVLVHELVHAVHPEAGHKGPFAKLAKAIGLTGKMTATVAGPELELRLNALASELGPYPHAGINLSDRKKQTTRLNKAECSACGYTCRVTKKWLELVGPPLCPCNSEPMAMPEGESEAGDE